MREIYVSLVGDPVHAGDKALTRETSAKRGRVNRYATDRQSFERDENRLQQNKQIPE